MIYAALSVAFVNVLAVGVIARLGTRLSRSTGAQRLPAVSRATRITARRVRVPVSRVGT
jgi:hypothetical protein